MQKAGTIAAIVLCAAVTPAIALAQGNGNGRANGQNRETREQMRLRAMGAWVEELPDGLKIEGRGGKLDGGASVDSAHDHRIALALSVAALVSHKPTVISGIEWADVSFPGFFRLLRRLGAEVEILP